MDFEKHISSENSKACWAAWKRQKKANKLLLRQNISRRYYEEEEEEEEKSNKNRKQLKDRWQHRAVKEDKKIWK